MWWSEDLRLHFWIRSLPPHPPPQPCHQMFMDTVFPKVLLICLKLYFSKIKIGFYQWDACRFSYFPFPRHSIAFGFWMAILGKGSEEQDWVDYRNILFSFAFVYRASRWHFSKVYRLSLASSHIRTLMFFFANFISFVLVHCGLKNRFVLLYYSLTLVNTFCPQSSCLLSLTASSSLLFTFKHNCNIESLS